MTGLVHKTVQWGSTACIWTNTEHVKQRSIEAMIIVVMLYALKKATEGRMLESGGSMTVGAILWMNHEAMIKQNLANTAVVFSTQIINLEGQLNVVKTTITELRQLRDSSGELVKDQEEQLRRLESQSASLKKDIESRKQLLRETDEQIKRLKDSVTDTISNIQKKREAILRFTIEANSKLESICPGLTPKERKQLVQSIQLIAGIAQKVLEPTK